ncbi:MAG TPA: tetratricopeptide repeat protein [Usitatibacter sp.]|nr:tetratricopeptide repeat protein [Usitatibacter sp.]
MSSLAPADELSIRKALQAGIAYHDAGRFAEAEAVYRRVLDAVPDRPEALVLLGDLAQRRGADEEALALLQRAVAIAPSVAKFQHQLGVVLHKCGRVDEAIAHLRRAVALRPDLADACYSLGNAFAASGRAEEAISSYRRALAAQPSFAAAHTNLGIVLQHLGRMDDALVAFRAALESADTPAHRANFARALVVTPRLPADAQVPEMLSRALAGSWARPGDLARPAITFLLADAGLRGRIESAADASAGAAPAIFDGEAFASLSTHRLLLALLENAQVCERRLEAFATAARRDWLEAALAGRIPDAALPFGCALARQCHLNDYVFAEAPDERARASSLARSIESSLRSAETVHPAALAAVAAYVPLASLSGAARLLEREWPPCVKALLLQQVEEPREEREDRARVRALTPIRDRVSLGVRRQYEENPYPRWTGLPPCEPLSFERYLRALFPRASLDFARLGRPIELLVAGCGTGQESADLARQIPDSRVLAVDLSLASLCYARRKTASLGIANVEYAQADILELASLGRTFDVISCVGVLHHLADPLAGWRALAACLRPGGFMQVGLYSEHGRRDLAAARALIAERGLPATPEGIRACRAALLAAPQFARVAALRDFFGMNECRDLIFHVQEHRFTFPRLAHALAQTGLELVGLVVDDATRRRYAERFPADAAQCDLASWDAFERELPDTFAAMYLFWVRKPGGD